MTEPLSDANPPAGGEPFLRFFLKPTDRDSVSGDLLEEYREMVLAGRDRAAADRWYLRQVAGFLWRATWAWATLLAVFTLGRSALDVFLPPASFATRATVTTYGHIAIFIALGFHSAWRGRSLADSVAAVVSTQIMANLMIFAGSLAFLGIWHDSQTVATIERTGGWEEFFLFFPVFVTFVGVLLSILGGAAALRLPRPRLKEQS
jgi:hypothetical protein